MMKSDGDEGKIFTIGSIATNGLVEVVMAPTLQVNMLSME